jgi:hypothetical protein
VSDFPTIVYKSPGRHSGPPGKTYDYKGVADESEMAAALADGWFRTLSEACDPPAKPAQAPVVDSGGFSDEAPPTRTELETKARELGLSFDGRTTDKRLAERIAAALAEG